MKKKLEFNLGFNLSSGLRVFIALLLALLLTVTIGGNAKAISDPDYVSIGDVAVFTGLVQTGDQLFFCRYDVSYNSTPDEDADETWQMAIYTPSGNFTSYSRPLNYYQHNIISIYLTADQALTWGAEYQIKIMGNPALFDPLVEGTNMRTQTLSSGDYHYLAQLGGFLISQADIVGTDWGIALLTSGDLLNTTGATYFLKAIPGLNSIVPEIFQVTTSIPSLGEYNWTTNQTTTFSEHKGTILEDALDDIGSIFGIDGMWVGIALFGMLAGLLGMIGYGATGQAGGALAFGAFALPVAVWMGIFDLVLFIIIIIVMAVIFGIIFILGRFG